MKLIDIPTRDLSSKIAVTKVSGLPEAIVPFILMEPNFYPLWIMPKPDPSFTEKQVLMQMAWGKGYPNQSIDRYKTLPYKGVKGRVVYTACCLGLYELLVLGHIPTGDHGEAYRVEANYDGASFFGVWADSNGAARRFLNQVVTEFGMEEEFRRCGIDPKIARSFEQL